MTTARRVLFHCNAGADYGMGHLMRVIAIARTAKERGWATSIAGDLDEAATSVLERFLPGATPPRPVSSCDADLLDAARGADVVHLDTYWSVPDLSSSGALVSNMQDGSYGVRAADLSIDANLGSERTFVAPELGRAHLAGIDAAVIRDQVRRQRDAPRIDNATPRVLVVMGGTDPGRLTARIVAGLDSIEGPLEVTAVDPRERPEVVEAARASRHVVRIVGFVDDLPALARAHDLAVTAAGTSVWDFACMGLPMALVCAVDNQRAGYREVLEAGLAEGLGEPPHDDLEQGLRSLGGLMRSRRQLAERGARLSATVDGLGTWRIVASWEQLLRTPRTAAPTGGSSTGAPSVRARLAREDDAELLLAWRNDEVTRRNSRDGSVVDEQGHLAWLTRSLAAADRRLLVIEEGGVPVATCRWDRRSTTDWEVSITVAPDARGRGVAGRALAAAQRALIAPDPVRMIAVVHEQNAASRRVFERAGYLPQNPADEAGFLALSQWRLRQR
ncbi:bifunctional UDP-2,4-diacetamido-2,4,6-trideoxy-beta-L-altropyranose hydrolase/GNAT family N-acetyltransferase [Microbacterium sp. LS_15]|uniref:GNAT family N-acetyltransferase n=1 Tax=Microbacterium sp. LS_15 TaxID=3055790 RepID=UPI0035C1C23C